MGMFTTRDPIELNGGLNVFAYVLNPTGWVDSLGLSGDRSCGGRPCNSSVRDGNSVPFIPPAIPEENAAVLVGYGDGLILGGTKYIRDALEISSRNCSSCIELYSQGNVLGNGVSTVAASESAVAKNAPRLLNNSLSSPGIGHRLFTSNRKNGTWNTGKTRFGWSGKNGSDEYSLILRHKKSIYQLALKLLESHQKGKYYERYRNLQLYR